MKIFWKPLLFLLMVIPLLVGFDLIKSPFLTGKFSYGGMRLTVSSDIHIIVTHLNITYCDGSVGTLRRNFLPEKEPFTFIAEKPMKQVAIISSNPKVTQDGIPRITTVVRKKCSSPNELPKLYCNHVIVADTVYRSNAEPISFKSTHYVFRAGLKIPGIDGVTWIRKLYKYPFLGQGESLNYNYSQHEWTGTFPSMRIPIGQYQKVELVVQDEYGQQAKCRIGGLKIRQ